jgi:predicted Zn-dependent protease
VADRIHREHEAGTDGFAVEEHGVIDDALAIARAAEGDIGNDLFDPLPARPVHGLDDPAIRESSVDDAVALALRMLEDS